MARTSKEYQAFTSLTDRLLSVSKDTLDKRIEEHRKRAEQNPDKRGPKRKVKPSASDPDTGGA